MKCGNWKINWQSHYIDIYTYIHFHRYTQTIHLIYTSDVRFGPLTKPAPAEWSLWGWLMLSPIFYTLRIINIFSQNRLTPPKRGMFIILCRHSSQNAIDRKTSTTLCKRKCGWWCVVVVVVAMPPSVFRDAIYISMLSATYSVYRCVRCGMWKSVWSGNHKRW